MFKAMSGSVRYKFLNRLEEKIAEVLKTRKRVLISVVGGPGTGKSYFGKYLRNNGIGRFSKREIAVIDDSVLKLDFLLLLRRSVRIPCNGVDELRPFLNMLTGRKKAVFFLNATPERRITEADILLKLSAGEEIRKRRLRKRDGNDPEKLERFLNYSDPEKINIKYRYLMEEVL